MNHREMIIKCDLEPPMAGSFVEIDSNCREFETISRFDDKNAYKIEDILSKTPSVFCSSVIIDEEVCKHDNILEISSPIGMGLAHNTEKAQNSKCNSKEISVYPLAKTSLKYLKTNNVNKVNLAPFETHLVRYVHDVGLNLDIDANENTVKDFSDQKNSEYSTLAINENDWSIGIGFNHGNMCDNIFEEKFNFTSDNQILPDRKLIDNQQNDSNIYMKGVKNEIFERYRNIPTDYTFPNGTDQNASTSLKTELNQIVHSNYSCNDKPVNFEYNNYKKKYLGDTLLSNSITTPATVRVAQNSDGSNNHYSNLNKNAFTVLYQGKISDLKTASINEYINQKLNISNENLILFLNENSRHITNAKKGIVYKGNDINNHQTVTAPNIFQDSLNDQLLQIEANAEINHNQYDINVEMEKENPRTKKSRNSCKTKKAPTLKKRNGLCSICGIKIEKNSSWCSHIREFHTQFEVNCSVCNKTFSCRKYLSNHIRRVHSSSKLNTYTCDYCNKSFKGKEHIKHHICNIHLNQGKVTCKHCGSVLKCKKYLRAHFNRVHYNDGYTYYCTCGKGFRSPRYLRIHKKNTKHGPDYTKEKNNNDILYTEDDMLDQKLTDSVNKKKLNVNHCFINSDSNTNITDESKTVITVSDEDDESSDVDVVEIDVEEDGTESRGPSSIDKGAWEIRFKDYIKEPQLILEKLVKSCKDTISEESEDWFVKSPLIRIE